MTNGSVILAAVLSLTAFPAAAAQTIDLSFSDAVQLALKQNLQSLTAAEKISEAKGDAMTLYSELWPQITATAYQKNATSNLAGLGFEAPLVPGTPIVIGPYGLYDARLHLVENLLDARSFADFAQGRAEVRLAKLEQDLSRPAVAEDAAMSYIEAQRSAQAVAAAHANLDLAKSLYVLAQDEHQVGLAQGVDVARAKTRVAQEKYSVARADLDERTARIDLERVLGLPMDADLILTDSLRDSEQAPVSTQTAISEALESRVELSVAKEELRVEDLAARSAEGALLPSLSVSADYGLSGTDPSKNVHETREVGALVSLPLFDGSDYGRVRAALSREKEARLTLGDLKQEIEKEVRIASAQVLAAQEQVRAADESLGLAQKELDMARDRFRSGVADNLEVLSAQTSIEVARDEHVSALAFYNQARVRLAVALGKMDAFQL
ncbi:MAG: TolC family protein [Elusimicrobia bacterium]|nr:TolC family protein [Elusimicrobiota bacterium]